MLNIAKSESGLTIIFTGNGKGKTTAAIGMGLRATGHNKRVLMIQFVKGSWRSGETKALEGVPLFEVVRHGAGFTWEVKEAQDGDRHRTAAAEALEMACRAVASPEHDLIILDEICVAVSTGLLSEDDVLDLMAAKPPALHLVLTGRGATARMIDAADLVSEVQEVKHPFRIGVKAQRGIEF